MEVGADDIVRGRVRLGEPARQLRAGQRDGREAERLRRVVAGLELEFVQAHAAAVEPRRRAGLQASELDSGGEEAGGEALGAGSPMRPPDICAGPTWMSPRRNVPVVRTTARLRISIPPRQRMPVTLSRPRAAMILDEQRIGGRLKEREIRLLLDPALHGGAIRGAVVLRPRRPDRRAFAGVEHAELDAGLVGRLGHLAAERVNLADELALREAADGGIAGHLADLVGAEGDEQRAAAHPRRRQRRLAACVSGADDDDVEGFGHGLSQSSSSSISSSCSNGRSAQPRTTTRRRAGHIILSNTPCEVKTPSRRALENDGAGRVDIPDAPP